MNQNENAALVIKKYVLTAKTILYLGHTLHRIRAIRDFGNVKAGSLGGWIESEKNLFHRGNASGFCSAWVCGNAKVYGDARVCDDARVYGHASVSGKARVCGNARIYDHASVYGNAEVDGDARVGGYAGICDRAEVYGNARVYGDAWVDDDASVYGNARVYGDAEVCGGASVFGNAKVCGAAVVRGHARVCGGKWEVSPYYIQGSIWSVNIASPNEVQCGCQRHTWKEWHDNYLQISREHNADHVLQEYIQYFNLLCSMYGHWACEINVPPTLSAGLSGSAQ